MRKLFLLLALSLAALGVTQEINVKTLLSEMTDLERLARKPSPAYTAAQASSYDRASQNPSTDWFSNADAGQFLRVEEKADRREYTMAELHGPGAVVRVWSANPTGVIRFYFDGEEQPRIRENFADLLAGKVEPFGDPFAYFAARGGNLYFPIPYEKSLKVTVDDSQGEGVKGLYYHVGYRTYAESTRVASFTAQQVKDAGDTMKSVAATLNDPTKRKLPKLDSEKATVNLNPAGAHVIDLPEGSKAIYELRMKVSVKGGIVNNPKEPWDSPLQVHNALRKLVLTLQFDEDQAVNVPLGDFFGAAPGLNPYKTFPMEVQADGTMICRFVMPYQENAAIVAVNEGGMPVTLELEAKLGSWNWDANSYHFNAQWTVEQGSTGKKRDMTFLNTAGEGIWLGSNLHVANPSLAWWGEGDEKVYVDGEAFPSTFGTGTEDYYGYAWCDTGLFSRPYHAQARADGPGNQGHASVNRWHVFDPIPYTKSFKFDMEMWHWADVQATYARTAYWYAKPGSSAPVNINRLLLLPPLIEGPKSAEGAIEGEGMKVISKSGGVLERQSGFEGLSAGVQLWWKEQAGGDKLVLEMEVPQMGEYEVLGRFCTASDYGIHAISINGNPVEPIDFYSDKLEWKVMGLGTHKLPAGTIRIDITCQGKRDASTGRMFGLDYLRLIKK